MIYADGTDPGDDAPESFEIVPPMVIVCAERGEHQWPNNDPEPFGYGDIIAFKCATCDQWVTT